jgi:hypothetical protein
MVVYVRAKVQDNHLLLKRQWIESNKHLRVVKKKTDKAHEPGTPSSSVDSISQQKNACKMD